MAGIKDVAKKAGVGVGTVSRAVNNTGYVADATRKKIEAAMKELNYYPNELARNLYHSRTGIVGILVPTVSHPFFSEFVNYAENELYERGYKTMICNTNKEKNYEIEYLEMLKRHIVDGLITGVHSLNNQVYINVDKPIVALDRYIGEKIPVVSVNHIKAGHQAAELLYNSGCKNIVQFSQAKQVEAPALELYDSFEKSLSGKKVNVFTYELERNKFEISYFMDVCERAYAEHPEVDGMFGTDLLAMCYMKVAQKKGRKIPDELQVIAYDGTYVSELQYPSLTIIKQPIQKLASEAARLIVNKIEGKEYFNRTVELEASIIKGETTIW